MEHVLRFLGGAIIVIGFIAGSISGIDNNNILLIYFLSSLISGIFFIGMGEMVAYLHKIYLYLEPQQKEEIKS